jgi:hypothetical protein
LVLFSDSQDGPKPNIDSMDPNTSIPVTNGVPDNRNIGMALNDFAVQLGDYTPTVSIKFECVNRQ